MPAQVIQLDDRRPHVTIRTQAGVEHDLPAKLWHDIAAGKRTVDDLGLARDELLRLVVAEWLAGLGYAEAMGLLEMAHQINQLE